jgi:Protein of unknown function (DUF1761)
MFNVLGQINWLGVAAATFATAMLGAVWFTALSGKYYTVTLGREGQPPFKMTPIFMAGPFLCGLFTCIASAVLIRALGINNFGDGLMFGLIVGLSSTRSEILMFAELQTSVDIPQILFQV